MHPFEATISVVGPIVGGIIVLTLFFKSIAWLGRRSAGSPTRIAFKGILDERTVATVYLSSGASLANVRLIGFTDSSSIKGPFPYELNGMVILEHDDRRRTMIPAKSIRMIEVAPETR